MTRVARIVLIASVLALPLAGCGGMVPDIDPTEWFAGDFFNTKKKLPGDRKAVFPEGVPGVAQGIPQDLVKGNQPPPDVVNSVGDPQGAPPPAPRQAGRNAPKQATATPPDEYSPAPREKAKPKPKAKPKQPPQEAEQPPTTVTVRRAPTQQQPQQQPQQGGANSPWPDPPQQQPQRSQPSSGGIQWPDPPPVR
jgi:hypothetical protein